MIAVPKILNDMKYYCSNAPKDALALRKMSSDVRT